MAITITDFSGGVTAVNPSESLINTSNYLYSLCGKYAPYASNLISIGGQVAPIAPSGGGGSGSSIYPFIITSANGDFEPDGVSYNNPAIVGDTLSLFINEYAQQWLLSGVNTFSYTATGFIINLPTEPPFNANTQDWTIMVQKITSQ